MLTSFSIQSRKPDRCSGPCPRACASTCPRGGWRTAIRYHQPGLRVSVLRADCLTAYQTKTSFLNRWQDCLDIVADDAELKKTFPNIPTGAKGIGSKVVQNTYDNAKSKKVLQMKYRSLEETTKDMAHSLAEREKAGWKN